MKNEVKLLPNSKNGPFRWKKNCQNQAKNLVSKTEFGAK